MLISVSVSMSPCCFRLWGTGVRKAVRCRQSHVSVNVSVSVPLLFQTVGTVVRMETESCYCQCQCPLTVSDCGKQVCENGGSMERESCQCQCHHPWLAERQCTCE